MRYLTAASLASFVLAAPAFAQGLGNDVQVNPLPSGSTVLIYPGGQYMRVVRPLLMPGQNNAPIHLHMPRKGAARPASDTAAVPAPRPRAKVAAAAPAPSAGTYYGGFGPPLDANSIFGGASAPPPAAPRPVAANPARAAPIPATPNSATKPKPVQLAKAEPPPPATPGETGLSKRSVILFAPQAADPAESALGAIKFLAGDLNTAMISPTSRIQIQAFGGQRGDKGSDARRLSLKRALSIRQVLIDDGVPSERIDVRAMGGADDSGPADRVDIYIKA